MIVIKFVFLGSLFSFTMYELKRKGMMVLEKGVQSFKKQKLPKKRRVRNELWAINGAIINFCRILLFDLQNMY